MRLPESVLESASWASVALVQVTLVALVGILAWFATRRGGPALRGAVLAATLVALVLVPAFATLMPTWLPLPEYLCLTGIAQAPPDPGETIPAIPPPVSDQMSVRATLVTQPSTKAPANPSAPPQDRGETLPPEEAEVVLSLSIAPETVAPPAPIRETSSKPWPVAVVLAGLWLLGAIACLIRASWRLAVLYRLALRARPVVDGEWTDCVASLARRHGLATVELRESPAIASPLTLGLVRPLILLPFSRRNWSAEQRELILAHELAHVRRRDFLAGLVAELIASLCWFHPLIHWLAARMRLEQEYAADAWAASATNDPTEYVCCLARLALEQSGAHPSAAPALWRRRPEILRRIDMLRRNPKGLPLHLGKRGAWTVAALTLACLAIAGVGPLRSTANDPRMPDGDSDAKAKPTADAQGDPLPDGALARLGTTRLRHGADVTFVAFGAEGKTLVTAGQDNTIRVWDLANRKEIHRFAPPKPIAPKPLPRGDKPEENARLEAMMQLMAGARNDVSGFRVALSPDGKTLAASNGNAIQLWELDTGKELRQIESSASGLAGLLFSADGRTLAGRSGNGSLFLWSVESGKQLHQVNKPPARQGNDTDITLTLGGGGGEDAPGMVFTPDGKLLAGAATEPKEDGVVHSIKFWDVASGKETRKLKVADGVTVSIVAIAPGGKVLAHGAGNSVVLCDAETGKEIHQLKTGDGGVRSLVFSPDGKTLAVRGRNQRVRLWETETGKEIHQLQDAEPPQRTGGGFTLVAAGGFSAPETRALAISPDGKRVASAAGSTVRLWETATGKELSLIDGHWRAPTLVVLSPDGKTVVSWGFDRVVRRWEAATGKALGAFPAPPRTTLAAFSPDGGTVALANADNTIRIHETASGKELHRLKGHANAIAALAFAPGGKVLASRGNGDNTIRLHDLAKGEEVRQIVVTPPRTDGGGGTVIVLGRLARGSRGTGPGLAFSPDGKLVVAPRSGGSSQSNTLLLFDATTGKELRKIESSQAIASYAFAPDGRTLASENADRTITLWEVATGKERGQLGKAPAQPPRPAGGDTGITVVIDGVSSGFSEPGGPVGLTFSPDGRAIAVRGLDLSVRLWDVMAGKEIGQLKGHGGRVETVAFARNGKALASGATDTTVLLWDAAGPMKDLSKPEAIQLAADEVDTLWGNLVGEDAAKAQQSARKLSAAPVQALPLFNQNLKPAERVDPRKIDGWIADLDSEKFAVRQEAAMNLIRVGEQSVPALQKVLASGPPLETRKRVEDLVNRLTGGTLSSEQVRVVRAIEALEWMGSADARKLLRTLADGAPGTLPTREARAALDRLGQ